MEKLLPQNIEAECGVLGSIIIDPEAIVQVADFLYPEDFYRDAHRTIYEVILQLYEQREPADFITICDELSQQNKLEDVGGASYITSLVNSVPTSGNVEYYGRIVERTAVLRRLIHAAGQIAAIAYEEGDADAALDKAEQLIFAIGQRHSRSDFSFLRDLLSQYMDKLEQLHERRGAIVGVPTGFADLDRLTGGLQKSDLIVLAARPGVGKCLTARTLIDDPETGERLTIEECVRLRLSNVYGISEEGKLRPASVTAWVDSGVQPCYRVQTSTGRMVEVTGHHPFLTSHGWAPLHDLSVGQSIAVPRAVPAFGTDESWPLDMVRLLAYFIAEGGLTGGSPAFTNTDPLIIEDFKQIITAHFPTCALRQERITYTVTQPKNPDMRSHGANLRKNPVTEWLSDLGLMGKLSKDKFFPACVWKWSRRYFAEFLRILMSCDGSIYSSGSSYPRIEFTVAAPKLAADLHHAFIRFGIVAKYYQTSHGAWRVEITSPHSVRIYQEQIGWVGEKSSRFRGYTHVVPLRLGNRGHAPQAIWSLVSDAAKLRGLSLVELARRSGETTKQGKYGGYNAHKQRSIPRYRLEGYAEVLDDASLRRAASLDVYWDEIVSIEPIGEHQVYDLTVPDGSNFVAQDVFVHNTSMALSLAHNTAIKHQNSVAVFSLEMSKEQLVQRILSMDAGVDQQRLRTGWIEDDDWDRIVYAMGTLSEANIWIDDTASISTMEMRSKARRLQAEHGIDLIVIDYLQLMQATVGGKRNENRVQEISEISRSLKGLARELNVPVLALAQLSRAVESRSSKVPQLSDLRECVIGCTRLIDAKTGKWIPITNVQPGDEILGLGKSQRIEQCTVQQVWSTGNKPVYRLTLRTGRQLVATANHPLLTATGWKPLSELNLGERIATAMQLPQHGKDIPERADLCRFLGYMVGDGTYGRHRGIGFISSDPETFEDVSQLVTSQFPQITVQHKPRKGNVQEAYFVCTYANGYGKPYGNPLREWLRSLDVIGQKDSTKHVPDWVFEAGVVGAREFLAGYLSSDGCVKTLAEQTKGSRWNIQFDTVSRTLADDVQALLLRIGVVATINKASFNTKSVQPIYRINVAASANNLKRFAVQVPVRGKKGKLLQTMLVQLAQEQTNPGIFGLPQEVSIYLAQHANWRNQGKCMRREVCIEWAERLDDPILREWAASDLLWEEVKCIEPFGEAEVFDICVPECHNFIANGIVAHNSGSIEQDSDIVMFIYRDDVYNPESERKNIADIIVAKHRNGPVGEISLYFQANQTRFRDLELNPPAE